MKILLCNYRYFVSGGPERYMFNVENALAESGYEIIPFSIRYEQNQPTIYERYFVEPLGGRGEVYFRQQKWTLRTFLRTLSRLFYAPDVEHAVLRLVQDTKPQVAYVLHYLRKLSPSLLVGLKCAGVPIIVRLSDYAMFCPQAHFLRNERPCELCAGGNLFPSLQYRCVQGSMLASVLNFLATGYHQAMNYFGLVDRFVVTTRFMYQKMLNAGYTESQLCHIPTFVNSDVFHPCLEFEKRNYIAYVGRLEKIKGVHVLVDALGLLKTTYPDRNIQLRIAGGGDEAYMEFLKRRIQELGLDSSVIFLGEQNTEQIVDLLNRAFLSVVPSLCFENLPNAILESYACGTPVLASDIGSLVECVDEHQTGYLFLPGNPSHLAGKLVYCLDHPDQVNEMGRIARKVAETFYSPKMHLERLENLFKSVIS